MCEQPVVSMIWSAGYPYRLMRVSFTSERFIESSVLNRKAYLSRGEFVAHIILFILGYSFPDKVCIVFSSSSSLERINAISFLRDIISASFSLIILLSSFSAGIISTPSLV